MFTTGLAVVFGCVCKGTKVWTKEGKLTNIEDLIQSDGLIGYNGEQATAQNINWFKAPAKKPCYRITTDANTVLKCSDDHPLLITRRNFVKYINNKPEKKSIYQEAKYLQINDQLLIPEKIDVFGNISVVDARLFGLLIGDGNYTKGNTPTLSVAEKDIYDYIRDNGYIGNKSKTYNITNTQEYNQITLKDITQKLIDNGMYGQVKFKKRLPKDVHTYNKESLAELLAGYFDADGNVYYNEKKKIVRVVLTSVVKELLTEVKYYLMKFGINSSILKEDRKTTPKGYEGQQNYIYRLYISQQQDLTLFKNNIKLLSKNKVAKLDFIKDSKYKLFNTHFEINPLNNKKGYFITDNLKNLRYETIKSIEYIGEQDVYNLNCSPNHNYISNGFITRQTGGDMSGGSKDFSDMFYSPEQYNCLSFENVWDSEAEGTSCSFFVPQWKNKVGFNDKQGNTLKDKALEFDNKERLKIVNSPNSNTTLVSHAQENPNSPEEAFVIKDSNDFPIKELNTRLAKLKRDNLYTKLCQPVSLQKVEGVVKIVVDLEAKLKPLWFHKDKGEGCVVIYEAPIKGERNSYAIGYDPYRQDIGTSNAAIYIYRKSGKLSKRPPKIVASFIGRPKTFDTCNYIALMLSELYDSDIMYENEVPEVAAYFANKNKLSYLAVQPDAVIDKISGGKSKVKRKFGMHMNDRNKDAGEKYIKKWLLTVINYDEQGNEITVLDELEDIGLIEELIKYRRKFNADRVMALMQIMFQLDEDDESNKTEDEQEQDFIK
jgi:intein/homing endonuclease